MEEIRWGIIGCGKVTEVKSGPALQKIEHSRLVAVMRRSAEKAEDYAKRHNVPQWYSDADALINDPEVNAVYVATPPETHAKYAIQAMTAGKPVYVEKPMALNHQECEEMNRVSKETGMPLFVAYYRRRLPGFLKVKELLEAKAIGDVRLVNIRFYRTFHEEEYSEGNLPWRVIPEIAGGGLFFDLAAHQLDILDNWFGPIRDVRGQAFNQAGAYPAEDMVLGNWQHETGVAGTGTWCFTTSEQKTLDEIEIIGSTGNIRLSTFEFTPVIIETASGKQEFPFPAPDHVQQNLLQTIVDELRGSGKAASTGESAARTSRVMDEMVSNFYSGK